VSKDKVTIGDLRAMTHIEKLVDARFRALGVLSSVSSSDNESSTSNSSDSEVVYSQIEPEVKVKSKHKHRASKTRSDIRVKSSDKVRYPQIWPHSMLQFQFVNKSVRFNDLDFNLFVAGELETISSDSISNTEKLSRIELLRKLLIIQCIHSMYYVIFIPPVLDKLRPGMHLGQMPKHHWRRRCCLDSSLKEILETSQNKWPTLYKGRPVVVIQSSEDDCV
jgi:hypothetical protein